nr:hypothetical protein [uncultured Dethiosulfovibrio sp.]
MQWVKKYWHKTRKFLEENFLVSVLVLLLLQVLLLMRFEKVNISWSALSATVQLLLVMFQCVIFYRQAKIMDRQSEISQKGLAVSQQANAISKEITYLPTKESSFWTIINKSIELRDDLIKVHSYRKNKGEQEHSSIFDQSISTALRNLYNLNAYAKIFEIIHKKSIFKFIEIDKIKDKLEKARYLQNKPEDFHQDEWDNSFDAIDDVIRALGTEIQEIATDFKDSHLIHH